MKTRYCMLLCFTLCLLQSALQANTVQLRNFTELMSALKLGHKVRTVIHYGKCKMISGGEEKKAPDAIGGLEINPFEYFSRNSVKNPLAFVVFSHTSLINYKGYIYNYAKFKIYEDNRVEVTAQYAKTLSYRVIMDETFHTVINDKTGNGALFLYCDM